MDFFRTNDRGASWFFLSVLLALTQYLISYSFKPEAKMTVPTPFDEK